MEKVNPRQEKGKQIALQHNLTRIRNDYYRVKSQTINQEYDVVKSDSIWHCNCPDHKFRKICCKHIHAVEFSILLREKVKEQNKIIIKPIQVTDCLFCHGINLKKYGIRHNKSGDIQRFICSDCNHTFSLNIGFEKMQSDPQIITSAMQLSFTGESFRNVQKFLRLQGVEVAHSTIYKWIKKYTELMQKYVDQITPQVSDTWRADELFLKVKGNTKYLYALMDDETRFWIAKQVSDNKYKDDIRQMLRDGKELTGKKPKVFITDGARNFHQAFQKEFYTHKKEGRPIHIQHIHFKRDMNNNKMERLNGEIRDREKVMRGLKKTDSPMISGYQLYHNYIRNHMGLEGKTPAEKCGIKIEGENKWITLIQNASYLKKSNEDLLNHLI